MGKILVDLHTHSFASDGTDTPEEILKLAKENQISIIAISDHNTIQNQSEAQRLAKEYDIKVVSAVELNCGDDDTHYHILGLGFDHENEEFVEFVEAVSKLSKANNRRLIELMSDDHDIVDIDEFDKYEYLRSRGGWDTINYLQDKGLADSFGSACRYYYEYDCPQEHVDFPTPATTIDMIHRAGGYAVLAHPGQYVRRTGDDSVLQILQELTKQGIDGIECHYPKHTEYLTSLCVQWCRDKGMMITGGSDYHGTFVGGNRIDSVKISLDMLELFDLVED